MPEYGEHRPEDLPEAIARRAVVHRVMGHAVRDPDRLALVAHRDAATEIRRSYAALRDDVVRLADGLRALDVTPGERIGLFCDSETAYQAVVTLLAANLMGAAFVPLNARYSARELKDAALRSSCVVILAAAKLAPLLQSVRTDLPDLRHVIIAESTFESVLAQGNPAATGWPELDPEATSEIMFTSGTTALPKAAIQTYGRTGASSFIYNVMLEMTPKDTIHCSFPIFTSACTKCVLLPGLSAGCTVVIDPVMNLPDILARMRTYRTSIYYSVPAFFMFLLDMLKDNPLDLPDARLFAYGGSAMPPHAIQALAQRFPHVGLVHSLGSTETCATGAILYPRYAAERVASVGKAFPYTEVRLVDDAGQPVPHGTRGEFAIRSPAVFKGYLNDHDNTAATLRDGWVMMGDIGVADEEGFLYHVDRKKDIIIRGGHNIGSIEVESVIHAFPGVAEVAAVGAPHPRLGEDVMVFVVATKGKLLDREALLAWCRENLADYKVPRHLVELEALPRNPMGKVLKTELRDKARDYMAARATA